MRARVARYYGFTLDEVESYPFDILLEYWIAITPLEAQELLHQIQCSSFSDMADGDRKRLKSDLESKLIVFEEEQVSPAELMQKFKGITSGR